MYPAQNLAKFVGKKPVKRQGWEGGGEKELIV